MSRCAIDNCDQPAWQRGLCSMHYQRWRRWGDPYFVMDAAEAGRRGGLARVGS